jgi:hypothetical protein
MQAWSKLRKVRSNTSESERMRIQHQSIKPQQPTTRNSNYHRAPTHPNPQTTQHTQHIRKCLSSSAKVAPSPLPPRRSQQQKPRSRWFPTCSTSKASSPSHQNIHERACALSLSSKTHLRTNTLSNNRLVDTCTKKCIPPQYREADLNKGESVCLDRCVSKFFEVNVKVSEKMQGEAQAKQGGGFA